jgi:hypothetical protein
MASYIGNFPVSGDNSFRILDDISTFTQTFDGASSATVSVSDSSISLTGHRFITGQRVLYSTTGTAIGGLTSGTYYYIIKVDQNTIRLATSLANANNNSNITLTALGTGTTHTLVVGFDGINTKFKATYNNGTKAQVTRGAQLQISINGVLQQPSDSSTPSNGFGIETDSTIVFSVPPVDTDAFWGNVIANNYPTFDTSDNTVDSFVGNGSQTNFTLSKTPPNNQNVLVTINGVVQYPDDATTVRAYSVIGNVLTFVEAPGSGTIIQVRHIGFAGATSSAVTGFYGRTGNVGLTTNDSIVVSSILVGTATSSGTANQRLQVAGGSYISGNLGIGITNPPYNLTVSPTGTPALSGLTSCVADFTAFANNYTQVNLRNSNTGNAASADFVVTADNGSDTTNFIDLGINNSEFSTSTWTINGANDGYLYTSDGSLSIGVAGIGKTLSFFTGGTLAANERLKITGGTIKIGSGATTGTANQDLQVTGGAYFSGSVGIGTTNPTAQLQINSSTSNSFYSYRNSGENSAWVVTGDSNVAALRFQNSLMHYRIGIQGSTQLVIRDVTNTGNRVAITSTGEVLVNTTTATGTSSQPLQVSGGAYFNGNVGVGTTNPLDKLHVLGDFLVAAGSSTGQHITQKAYELNNGTMSWEGSAGQLFSITNNLTSGSIFSVNDVSGIPSIDVDANGTIALAPYGTTENVGVGTTSPTSKLTVEGNALITGILTATTGLGGDAFESYEIDLVPYTSYNLRTVATTITFDDSNTTDVALYGTIVELPIEDNDFIEDSTYIPYFDGEVVSITNPFKLMITVNGVLQSAFINNTDNVYQSNFLGSHNGYTIDSDNNIKFTESIPTGSDIVARVLPASSTATKIKNYPFKPTDIVLGY